MTCANQRWRLESVLERSDTRLAHLRQTCSAVTAHRAGSEARDDAWRWKDRDDVAEQVHTGRLTPTEAAAVRAEATVWLPPLDHGDRSAGPGPRSVA